MLQRDTAEYRPLVDNEAEDYRIDVARRLRRLRLAYGYTSVSSWARFVEIERVTWLSYEAEDASMYRMIPPRVAVRLAARTGVTTDWIYSGEERALRRDAKSRLDNLPLGTMPPKRHPNIRRPRV